MKTSADSASQVDADYLLLLMLGAYVGVLIAANAAGSKLIAVGSLAASATVFAYAISFLVTDLASELYGRRMANRFVVIGFLAVLTAVLFFRLALLAPAASFYEGQAAFEVVFSTSPRLLLGGLSAYLVSQFLDIRIFHAIRARTGSRLLWVRNNVSTLISQLVDTTIFITVAFYGVVENLPALILGQYLVKVVIALLDTPVMYLIRNIALARGWVRMQASDS